MVRFDSAEDRERHEVGRRVVTLARQEDITGAAVAILDAFDRGLFDIEDLLDEIPDDLARDVIGLEVEERLADALAHMEATFEAAWPKALGVPVTELLE